MNEWSHIEVPTDETGEPLPYDVVIDPRTGKPYRGVDLDDLRAHDEKLLAEHADGNRDGNDDD